MDISPIWLVDEENNHVKYFNCFDKNSVCFVHKHVIVLLTSKRKRQLHAGKMVNIRLPDVLLY